MGTRIFYAGADVRVEPVGDAGWDSERRAGYLLRDDVVFPLSIDLNVWATVPGDLDTLHPWVPIEEAALRAASIAHDSPVWLVAFGAAAEDEDEVENLRKDSGIETPLAIDPSWAFLGFDIADGMCG